MTRFAFVFSLIFGLGLGLLPADAQTTHVVTLSGVTFSPDMLTIESGDTVRWENDSGSHNVNGSIADYPANPEGFFSGSPAPAPWNYEFTFTLVGDYDYHCDLHGSPGSGMIGRITVDMGTAAEDEFPAGLQIDSVYPNPFRSETAVAFTVERTQHVRVAVFDALGREIAVLQDGVLSGGTPIELKWNPTAERSGVYVIDLKGETFHETRRVIHVK